MSKRSAHIVVLCEDRRHSDFVRRFLVINGWDKRRIYSRISSGGSAEQFVKKHFPEELLAYRSRRHKQKAALFVVTDADTTESGRRIAGFKSACSESGVEFRRDDEKVIFVIPKRNIETWFRYLAGDSFDEQTDFSNLARQNECSQFVKKLHEMCLKNKLEPPPPPSLNAACEEYKRLE